MASFYPAIHIRIEWVASNLFQTGAGTVNHPVKQKQVDLNISLNLNNASHNSNKIFLQVRWAEIKMHINFIISFLYTE